MASKSFCDICENLLSTEDNKPFIRYHPNLDFKIAMLVTDSAGNFQADVCQNCRLLIAVDGFTPKQRLEKPLDPKLNTSPQKPEVPHLRSSGSGGSAGSKSVPTTLAPDIYVPSLKSDKTSPEPEPSSKPSHPQESPPDSSQPPNPNPQPKGEQG